MARSFFLHGTVFFLAVFFIAFLAPKQIFAQTRSWSSINSDCTSTESIDTGNGPEQTEVATIEGVECLVTNILNIATSLIGIASFIMLIVGGLLFLTSGGNPKATDAGKKTLSFAIAGILLAVSSWIILNFIATFTGVSGIKFFNITI